MSQRVCISRYTKDKWLKNMDTIKEIETHIKTIDGNLITSWPELAKSYIVLARLYIKDGDEEKAYDAVKHAFFYMFLDNEPYEGKTIFSFRSFSDYSIKDIADQKVNLSHPSQFNDPLDTVLIRWLEKKIAQEGISEKSKILSYNLYRASQFLKVRCFVEENPNRKKDGRLPIETLSPLMWAHYADSHKGFCAEYEIPDGYVKNVPKDLSFLRFGKEIYSPSLGNIDEMKLNEALLWKSDIWSYENEFRLIDLDFTSYEDFKEVNAPKLKAIYIGLKCSTENENKMKVALRSVDNQNVKLYRMEYDKTDFGEIKARRIW